MKIYRAGDTIKCKTKDFGVISLDMSDPINISVFELKYQGKEISIGVSFLLAFHNKKLKYIKRCLPVIDRYMEIYEMTKKAIMENYTINGTIKNFFRCHFEMMEEKEIINTFGTKYFQELDIGTVVEKPEYPCFFFDTCISKEVFLLVQYRNLLPQKDVDVELWVEIDIDNEIIINDFVEPY